MAEITPIDFYCTPEQRAKDIKKIAKSETKVFNKRLGCKEYVDKLLAHIQLMRKDLLYLDCNEDAIAIHEELKGITDCMQTFGIGLDQSVMNEPTQINLADWANLCLFRLAIARRRLATVKIYIDKTGSIESLVKIESFLFIAFEFLNTGELDEYEMEMLEEDPFFNIGFLLSHSSISDPLNKDKETNSKLVAPPESSSEEDESDTEVEETKNEEIEKSDNIITEEEEEEEKEINKEEIDENENSENVEELKSEKEEKEENIEEDNKNSDNSEQTDKKEEIDVNTEETKEITESNSEIKEEKNEEEEEKKEKEPKSEKEEITENETSVSENKKLKKKKSSAKLSRSGKIKRKKHKGDEISETTEDKITDEPSEKKESKYYIFSKKKNNKKRDGRRSAPKVPGIRLMDSVSASESEFSAMRLLSGRLPRSPISGRRKMFGERKQRSLSAFARKKQVVTEPSMEPPLIHGYLQYQVSKIWKEKWVILNKEKLEIYKDNQCIHLNKAYNVTSFMGLTFSSENEEKKETKGDASPDVKNNKNRDTKEHMLTLDFGTKTINLAASSRAELLQWVIGLHNVYGMGNKKELLHDVDECIKELYLTQFGDQSAIKQEEEQWIFIGGMVTCVGKSVQYMWDGLSLKHLKGDNFGNFKWDGTTLILQKDSKIITQFTFIQCSGEFKSKPDEEGNSAVVWNWNKERLLRFLPICAENEKQKLWKFLKPIPPPVAMCVEILSALLSNRPIIPIQGRERSKTVAERKEIRDSKKGASAERAAAARKKRKERREKREKTRKRKTKK